MYPSIQKSRLVSFALVTLLLSLAAGTCHKLPAQEASPGRIQPPTQEQQKPGPSSTPAEERVRQLVERGDLKGLELYTLEVITLARTQKTLIADQEKQLADQVKFVSEIRQEIADNRELMIKARREYQQFAENAGASYKQLTEAFEQERIARQRAVDQIIGLKRRALWGFINAASLGASIGGWTTKTSQGAIIGGGIAAGIYALRP